MFCNSCGAEIQNGATFCTKCGHKVSAAGSQEPKQPEMAHAPVEVVRVQPKKGRGETPSAWGCYVGTWKKYATFSGRARRREYWFTCLFYTLIAFGLALATSVVPLVGLAYLLFMLASILPLWAVMVRRLHDAGHSGWFILWAFLPIVGPFILLIMMCKDSLPGSNKYGENPKGV